MSILPYETTTYLEGLMNDRQFLQMMDPRWRMIYPAPFFDPLAMQQIADPKIMIQWSRFFYSWQPVVNAAINKMVSYPITDFVFDTKDANLKKNYEEALDTINLRQVMVNAGLDYFVCGNSFTSVLMPFKRMLKCPVCQYTGSVSTTKIQPSHTGITAICSGCGTKMTPIIEDTATQNLADMRIITWNPLNMDLEYDEILNTYDYYFNLPNQIKQGIIKGEKKYFESYPQYFIDAAYQKKMLKLYSTKILHMRRPNHSAAYNKGWGEPLVNPSMKYLFYLMILMRAQESLAIDQILPWNILSPEPNAGTDPATDYDLGSWKASVSQEHEKWRNNPLHKSIMPIPLRHQFIGAQGKSLMLSPEMQEAVNQALAGMGVPNEFVYGGLSWSGANVSLRMLENQFINYRTTMQRLINHVVREISIYCDYPYINVRMQNFKMADDVAQKDILLKMVDGKIISKRTAAAELFNYIDFDAEQKTIEEETLKDIKLQAEVAKATDAAAAEQMRRQVANGTVPPGGMADGQAHGDNPEQRPPRSEGGNAQI
jgi:hypothetical protein